MGNEKKSGPPSNEPRGPQRKDESLQRQLDSKIRDVESQESLLLFLFVENYSKILTEPMIQVVWDFMEFLRSHGYHIVNGEEVFCVPFSHLVCKKNLK